MLKPDESQRIFFFQTTFMTLDQNIRYSFMVQYGRNVFFIFVHSSPPKNPNFIDFICEREKRSSSTKPKWINRKEKEKNSHSFIFDIARVNYPAITWTLIWSIPKPKWIMETWLHLTIALIQIEQLDTLFDSGRIFSQTYSHCYVAFSICTICCWIKNFAVLYTIMSWLFSCWLESIMNWPIFLGFFTMIITEDRWFVQRFSISFGRTQIIRSIHYKWNYSRGPPSNGIYSFFTINGLLRDVVDFFCTIFQSLPLSFTI